jgi:hypothetical protein
VSVEVPLSPTDSALMTPAAGPESTERIGKSMMRDTGHMPPFGAMIAMSR